MKIRILQFVHKGCFYCVCRDICLVSESKESFDDAVKSIKEMLSVYLLDKDYNRLQKMGWKTNGISINPPNFAEKELVEYARDFFNREITEYQIVETDVKTELGD